MSETRRHSSTESPATHVLPFRHARKAEEHEELVTATEVRRQLGVHEQKLYAWVAAGLVRSFQTRFTKWTLYSPREIRNLIDDLEAKTSYVERAA